MEIFYQVSIYKIFGYRKYFAKSSFARVEKTQSAQLWICKEAGILFSNFLHFTPIVSMYNGVTRLIFLQASEFSGE